MRTRTAHPASRPLPFRSLQELRRHLNYCFQLPSFYHISLPDARPHLFRPKNAEIRLPIHTGNDRVGNCRLISPRML
jgi:hypothetical protein